jgi:hypothetical protein
VNLKACSKYLNAMYPEIDIASKPWEPSVHKCSLQKDSKSCGVLVLEHARRLLLGQLSVDIDTSEAGIIELRRRMANELKTGRLIDVEKFAIALATESPFAAAENSFSIATPSVPPHSEPSSVVATPASPKHTETPFVQPARTPRRQPEELASMKVLVPETPRRSQLYKVPHMEITEARRTTFEVPQALASVASTDDTLEFEYSLSDAAEAVLGVEGLDRFKAGETVKFQMFPDGFHQETVDLLTAEMAMYMHHCPVDLSTGKAIPNMVHSVLQQAVRQSLSVWVVSALVYGTTQVIAIPAPGVVSGEMSDGGFHIDKHKLWEATVSLTGGISHRWSGLHMEPLWYPDGVQPMMASVRVGPARQWTGLHAIQQANSCFGAVRRDDRGFILTEFSDHLASSATLNTPIARALLGTVSWEHDSVTHYLAATRTRSSFDKAFQMQLTMSAVLGLSAAMSLQREYCRYGKKSWVVARVRSSDKRDTGWLQRVKDLLADRWNESWVQPETTHHDQAAPGCGRKREGSFADGGPMQKKKRI